MTLTKNQRSRKYYWANLEKCREIARKASAKYRLLYPDKAKQSQKKWNAKNPQKLAQIERKRQAKRYGLTLEQLKGMYKKQKNRCAGCRTPFSSDRNPDTDHDRKCCPGKFSCGKCVRGLLCKYCNSILGYAKDNIKTLKNLIVYLGGKL